MAPFIVRKLHTNDIVSLIDIPRSEGREMGLEPELETWHKVDPNGIFVAVDLEDGRIVGCCSAIILSENHGYIGMYVVSRRHRGGGLGRMLWQSAIAHLGNRNICLSSVEKMVQSYSDKSGFVVTADWSVELYYAADISINSHHRTSSVVAFPPHTIQVDPKGPFVGYVVDYDLSIHEYDRSAIVLSTVAEPGTKTLVAIGNLLDGSTAIVGYACMKKSLQGHWLIAPVYAEDFVCAHTLVSGLVSILTEEQRMDGIVAKLVSSNTEAAKLFYSFGLTKTNYQLKRLFTRRVIDIPVTRIFALQSSVFCTE